MGNVYTETIELKACNCDMHGAWLPSDVLVCMQETAGAHSALLGLDRKTMDSMGLAWVVSRLKVEFSRVPVTGEQIRVETYPTNNRHMFFPRSHIFRDAQGAEIGRANTLWVLMDVATRKITASEFVCAKMPDNSDMPMAAGMPATVRPVEGELKAGALVPQFTDLDINGHVNNTKYLDWCCNALGIEALKARCVAAFDVNYDAEILPGGEVRTELACAEDEFYFGGFSENKRHFGVRGRLLPR